MKKIGDYIQINDGLLDPDYEKFDMTGWKGVVKEILDEDELNETRLLLEIDWDVDTLNNLPLDYIRDSIEEGMYFDKMNMWSDELFLINKEEVNLINRKKTIQDLISKVEAIDFDKEDKAYAALFSSNNIDINKVNLKIYREYLMANLKQPVFLKGRCPFPWEEEYRFGIGNSVEYEHLKTKHPSYRDEFILMKIFNANVGDESGLVVKVKRKSDKKVFKIELFYLESVDKQSFNSELLNKYSDWIVNY